MSETERPSRAPATEVITCIVERGLGEKVAQAAMKAGAQGATSFFGRGTSIVRRMSLVGGLLMPEKEVVLVVTRAAETDAIWDAMVEAGKLRERGRGFMYVSPVARSIGWVDTDAG